MYNIPKFIEQSEQLSFTLKFATFAHRNQMRRYTQEDYIVHPIRVCEIVYEYTSNEDVLSEALLHDVVQDTNYSLDDIERIFGYSISKLVDELTSITLHSKLKSLPRRLRKEIEAEVISNTSNNAKLIKLADMTDNVLSINIHDPKFAIIYNKEKIMVLDKMEMSGKLVDDLYLLCTNYW